MAEVAFRSTREVILRSPKWRDALAFYQTVLALPVAYRGASIVGFETAAFRLYVEEGSAHAPVFELTVEDFAAARAKLLAAGCTLLEEDAAQPRCYLTDPFGFVFNLGRAAAPDVQRPDLSARPWDAQASTITKAPPAAIYRAFTTDLERWFAAPGTLRMNPTAAAPFYWEVVHAGTRHPHYGRFLSLEQDRRLEFTWLTSATKGVETVVTVTVAPAVTGTALCLEHDGFPDEESRDQHAAAWPVVLAHLDATIGTQ